MDTIIRIPNNSYIHIKDNIKNITYLLEGPTTYALKSNEQLVKNVTANVQLGNSQYIKIGNPVSVQNDKIEYEPFGQVKLRWGEEEIRTDKEYRDPFALYPGEEVLTKVSNYVIVQSNEQIKLRALRPFFDTIKNKQRAPGDIWMIRGPCNYVPNVESEIMERTSAIIIKPNSAIKIRAVRNCVDKYGNNRIAGEEWLIREPGSYLPNVEETIIAKDVKAETITDKRALHLKAKCNFTDVYGKQRKAGEEWLVTHEDADLHICDIHETIIKRVDITVLSKRQYCVIINPKVNGKTQYGSRQQRRGEASFFLQPGESFQDNSIKNVILLDENDALLLKAKTDFENKKAGDRWMIKGPCEFIPPLELEILESRRAIPLDDNEGIYVRDISTGEIRMVSGQTYLLQAHEELWNKILSPEVEELLAAQYSGSIFQTAEVCEKGEYRYRKPDVQSYVRVPHKVVTFRAPHNSAVQVYDLRDKKCRIVFGPEYIKLGPHEEFTVLKLSGKKPKIENQIKNLAILLGPDFMTDIIEVETKDHARLRLQLCYSWKFEVNVKDADDCLKLFTVNDFIGNAAKVLAAKIRGAVSLVAFETFHKNSANIVKSSIFGTDSEGKLRSSLKFNSNNLVITNVDIQSQEPIDQKTRDNLSKSTNLSIESINSMQQADATHKQQINAEESRGKLQSQKYEDDTNAEIKNIDYLKKVVATEAVKSTGQYVAQAQANAKSNEIKGKSLVDQSKLKVEALEIEVLNNLTQEEENIREKVKRMEQEINLDIDKKQKLAQIEVDEFKKTINAIGRDTIVAMAQAGPEMQSKLLNSLGIKSFLITDGKSPINLFNTAGGLVGKAGENANMLN
jgi:major vault protein